MTIANDGLGLLLSAIVTRAIDDIAGTGPESRRQAEPDHAMAFILSEDCESYCLYLDIDYESVKQKAAALYRRELEKETPDYRVKKHATRTAKTYRRVQTRQSPGKRNNSAYR